MGQKNWVKNPNVV